MKWPLLVLFLWVSTLPAWAEELESLLVLRAREALSVKGADPVSQGALLESYADSLKTMDVVLAARCLEVAGINAFRSNNLDQAMDRWRRGVDWTREAGETKSESSLLNALAIGYTAQGDVEGALPIYDRTLEIRETLADSVGLSRTWGNLAQAYTNIGRTAEALAATAEEEKWLAVVDNATGQVANAIRRTQLLAAMGRYEEAVLRGQGAVVLADSLGDGQAQGLAAMSLGNAQLDLGLTTEALRTLTVALDHLESCGDSFAATFVRQSLVQADLMLGRPEEALARVRILIPEVEEADHLPLLTVLKRNEGNALFALGREAEAEAALLEAQALFEDRRGELADERSRAGIFESSGEIYASLARCRLAAGDTVEAFAVVENGRAPAFRERAGFPLASLDEIQKALLENDAALVLFNDPVWDPLVAFVLDGVRINVVDLGEAGLIAADARSALRLLAAGESLNTCGPALARLNKTLSIPILDHVPAGTQRCVVIPPSFLAGFPLGILEDSVGQPWNGEIPLNYLPSATAMVRLLDRTSSGDFVTAFADPATGQVQDSRLPVSMARAQAGVPLPEARAEIAIFTKENDRRLVGAAATSAAFRSILNSDPAVLHLATHAIVDPVDGGRSGLVLAGPAGPEAVTAREIADSDFRGDLVVLSGCSTFGGHQVLGEGWFGLPRSFLAAGARTVLSTLWDVEDLGARIFMTAFYKALADGAARDEALVMARNHCRDAGMPPREWAAFVLSGLGNAGVPAVAGQARGSWLFLYVGGGILSLVFILVMWRRRTPRIRG